MGTNYYLKKNVCKCCNHAAESLHIGKSSAGWHFSLHVMPEESINNLADWRKLFESPDVAIQDEYDRPITAAEMLAIITERKSPHPCDWDADMYSQNHSVPGLNNLVRHKVDGWHCVGNGEGTWDYIVGEFS